MKNVPQGLLPRSVLLMVLLSAFYPESIAQKHPAPWVGETFWGTQCKGGGQGFGPFDYTQRANDLKALHIVEQAHWTPREQNINNLIRYYGDLDYTLRAWPNHHPVLNSVIIARRDDKVNFRVFKYPPAECYLQRAINYSPHDGVAHMLYGMLLQRMDRPEDALLFYRKAEKLAPLELQIKYNLGLLLVELGEYEEATGYAEAVYSRNFPLKGLQRQLAEKGYSVSSLEPN